MGIETPCVGHTRQWGMSVVAILALLIGGGVIRALTSPAGAARPHPLVASHAVASGMATTPTLPSSAAPHTVASPSARPRYVFGTLNAHPEHAVRDYAAGIRVVEMVVGWNLYEPQDGVFSDVDQPGSYAYRMKQALRTFQAAGLKVILSVSLHYTPGWVFTDIPDSRYVDQYGVPATRSYPNFTFSQALRAKAAAYIARVDRDLGLNNFWAVEIGSGASIETVFPDENNDPAHNNEYWAYDANAQGLGRDRPATIPPNPFPGWRPSDTWYDGQPFTAAQTSRWLDWYLAALMDGVNWQIRTYRGLGYRGAIDVKLAGWGNRPSEYAAAVANHLDGTGDSLQTLGRGAVWDRDIAKIADRRGVVIHVSSLDDSSSHLDGSVAPDLCEANDSTVALDDPRILRWSSARWIVYNARRFGLPTIGENPDPASAPGYDPAAMMRDSASIMRSCGMQGLLWAFDSNLYNGPADASIEDYGEVIALYSR